MKIFCPSDGFEARDSGARFCPQCGDALCHPCPSCGRKRVVTREACEHCGAAFGRPIQDGTEIFDGEVLESPQPPILGEPEKMGNAAPSGLRDTRT